ncbi:MAG: hypothetical protein H0Z28_13585 [Archaeoglobus sp.]|nr:hypothetical protein [Archaeoglobus sp.]
MNEFKDARDDIERELESLPFNPNLLLLFLTAGTFKDWKRYNELFQKHFPDVEMLGCVIEGYAAGDEIWTRGIVALLGEFDGEVKVYFERGNKVEEVCSRLGARIGEKYDSILAMFPAIYFPGRLDFARLFINDKRYYRRYKGQNTIEGKKEVLREFSRYMEEHFIFPIDKVLKYLSESTGRSTPILGMNLMPMEAKIGTPFIVANYKEVGRGIAAMCLKGKVNISYHDVYPERATSFEETVEMIENSFSNVEEVEVVKAGIAIGEISGIPPVQFLREKKAAYDEMREEEFIERVEKGALQAVSPYGLSFIHKNLLSVFFLGLLNSPVNIYPSLVELDEFYETSFFMGETFKGGTKKFSEIAELKKMNGFDLFLLDFNTIPAFRKEIYKILDGIKAHSERSLSIFTTTPSAYIPNYNGKRLFSEVDKNIFFNASGANGLLEF